MGWSTHTVDEAFYSCLPGDHINYHLPRLLLRILSSSRRRCQSSRCHGRLRLRLLSCGFSKDPSPKSHQRWSVSSWLIRHTCVERPLVTRDDASSPWPTYPIYKLPYTQLPWCCSCSCCWRRWSGTRWTREPKALPCVREGGRAVPLLDANCTFTPDDL